MKMRNVRSLFKTCLSLVIALGFVLGMTPASQVVISVHATDANNTYLDAAWDDAAKEVKYTAKSIPSGTTVVTSSGAGQYVTWSDGWYMVRSEGVDIFERVTVSGEANLILCDGASLRCDGITVNEGNTLNIYAQSISDDEGNNNPGKLSAIAEDIGYDIDNKYDHVGAGIGGYGNAANSGAINIYGGDIYAKGNSCVVNNTLSAAGIGGSSEGSGTVTVYGGSVTAEGEGKGEAAIGGGINQNNGGGCTVKIYGGNVSAHSKGRGAGVGSGSSNGVSASIDIYGGVIEACSIDGEGIGKGAGSSDVPITLGDNVYLCGSDTLEYTDDSGNTCTLDYNALTGGYDPNDVTFLQAGRCENVTYGIRKHYMKAEVHKHTIDYSASGATITADICKFNNYCYLTGEDKEVALTINAPTNATYGDADSAKATLTGLDAFNKITGLSVSSSDITYVGRNGTTYASSTTAPTSVGNYTASITAGGRTASVNYSIGKADMPEAWYQAPVGITATYGDTLANVALPTSTNGTWSWVDAVTTDVGSAGVKSFKAKFTPNNTNNYNSKTNIDVSVTVNRKQVTIKAKDQNIYVGGTAPDLSSPVLNTHYTVTGLKAGDQLSGTPSMFYEKDGEMLASGNPDVSKAGEYDIFIGDVTIEGSAADNYETIEFVKGKLIISNKSSGGSGSSGGYSPTPGPSVNPTPSVDPTPRVNPASSDAKAEVSKDATDKAEASKDAVDKTEASKDADAKPEASKDATDKTEVSKDADPTVKPSADAEPSKEPAIVKEETDTVTNADGTTTTVTTTLDTEGTTKTESETVKPDGTVEKITDVVKTDGTTEKIIEVVKPDGTTEMTTRIVDPDGDKTVIEQTTNSSGDYTKTTTTTNVTKDKNGNVTGESVSIETETKSGKATTTSKFKVVNAKSSSSKKEVAVTKLTTNSKSGTVTIGKTVKADGVKYNVTKLKKGMFKGGESKAKIINLKATGVTKIEKGAFSGIAKKATIKINASKKQYKKLVKMITKSGVAKGVKFKRV